MLNEKKLSWCCSQVSTLNLRVLESIMFSVCKSKPLTLVNFRVLLTSKKAFVLFAEAFLFSFTMHCSVALKVTLRLSASASKRTQSNFSSNNQMQGIEQIR